MQNNQIKKILKAIDMEGVPALSMYANLIY